MQVSAITCADNLQRVAEFWDANAVHPDVQLSQYRTVCDVRPNVLSPYVLVLGSVDVPEGLVVCRLERGAFAPRIGFLQLLRIPVRVLVVVYQGVVGSVEMGELQPVVLHLWSQLSNGTADLVEFHNVPTNGPLWNAIASFTPGVWRQAARASEHWSLRLGPGVSGQMYEGSSLRMVSGKHRKALRKKERDLNAMCDGEVSWKWLRDGWDIESLCSRLEIIAARTYQRGLNAGFKDDEEHRRRLSAFAAGGQLRVYTVEVRDETVAFWLGVVRRGVFHSWATAYNPELRQYELGNLMFHRMVDELAAEGVETLDFGLGSAFYKERFGDHHWSESTVRLFAPTPKGAVLRGVAGITQGLEGVSRQILDRVGLTDKVKQGWRRKLASG